MRELMIEVGISTFNIFAEINHLRLNRTISESGESCESAMLRPLMIGMGMDATNRVAPRSSFPEELMKSLKLSIDNS